MFTDVMVDCETTGVSSFDKNAMIQLAGVKFNIETQEVSPSVFNMSLKIPPNRFWDSSTREWWGKQKPHILQDILANGQDPKIVMGTFYSWLLEDYPATDDGLRFWSKPTHFDFSFVASYFHEYGFRNPCHYRSARDLNSFMSGLHGNANTTGYENKVEFDGDEHNALHDCLFQIKMLFAAKNATMQGVYEN